MTKSRDGGFSLVEVVIAAGLTLIVLSGVMTASKSMTQSVRINELRSQVTSALDVAARRIEQITRSGVRSTFQVKANQADVNAAVAAGETPPPIGSWIPAKDLEARSGIQLQSPTGTLPLTGLAPPISLEFQLEKTEQDNDVDDDGDGLVDEGDLVFDDGSVRIPILQKVETCSFELDGRALRIQLGCGRIAKGGKVYRTSIDYVIFIRNNGY